MFKRARIKLTVWYLAIIMVISLSFSGVIYIGINRELSRIEDFQNARIQTIIGNTPGRVLVQFPQPDIDAIADARRRIILTFVFINLSILFLSGTAGYFLAGRTLEPIAEMVEKQKGFVSDASHELRTPLTSLKTEIEVALRDKGPTLSKMKSLLKSNLEDVNRMQKLSNYLLNLNRYEKNTHLEFSDVDLKVVAQKAAANFKYDFDLDLKKSVVNGNEDALIELTTILLDNAIKYGQGKRVEVKTRGGIIEVQDHGIGISKEDLPHIFDRFYRSDKSRGTDGYGLGLSIAKSIVDLHKGSIKVESKLGKGSTFSVNLG